MKQINACFAHGREYFRNAARSDMEVKPLLLYYGVLLCCRGVILAKDPDKKEESLKPRHGLETVDWQHTLSGGIKNVLELRIRATDGTFGELVDVCGHLKTLHVFFRSYQRNRLDWTAAGGRAVRDGSELHVAGRPALPTVADGNGLPGPDW